MKKKRFVVECCVYFNSKLTLLELYWVRYPSARTCLIVLCACSNWLQFYVEWDAINDCVIRCMRAVVAIAERWTGTVDIRDRTAGVNRNAHTTTQIGHFFTCNYIPSVKSERPSLCSHYMGNFGIDWPTVNNKCPKTSTSVPIWTLNLTVMVTNVAKRDNVNNAHNYKHRHIFRITGNFCGKSTRHQWIPCKKDCDFVSASLLARTEICLKHNNRCQVADEMRHSCQENIYTTKQTNKHYI